MARQYVRVNAVGVTRDAVNYKRVLGGRMAVAEVAVGISSSFQNKMVVEYHDLIAFAGLALELRDIPKGTLIEVMGRLEKLVWPDETVERTKIVIESIHVVSNKLNKAS